MQWSGPCGIGCHPADLPLFLRGWKLRDRFRSRSRRLATVLGFESPRAPRILGQPGRFWTLARKSREPPHLTENDDDRDWKLLENWAQDHLTLPTESIQSEVDSPPEELACTVNGRFPSGKVPMNVVAQRYGYSVQYEVMNDKVARPSRGRQRSQLRVPAQPRITKEGAPEGADGLRRRFRGLSRKSIGDLTASRSSATNQKSPGPRSTRRLDILRKQRRTFCARAGSGKIPTA